MTELSPLSQRIEAPSRLQLPIHPDIASWRPATAADVDAIAELHAAADVVDHPHYVTSRDEIADEFGHSYVDLARDSLVGVTATGRVVAYGLNVFPPDPETFARVIVTGTTHPEVRGNGLGRQLLQWQRGRAQQMLAASGLRLPGWIVMYVDESNVPAVRLAELLGFHLTRYYATLTLDLAGQGPAASLEDGLAIAPWSDALSEPARLAKNDAFRDHWGSQPTSAEQWQGIAGGEFFRPELSFVVLEAAEAGAAAEPRAAGAVIVSVYPHDWERQGVRSAYVGLLATRRGWRAKGIGSSLLARVASAAREQGLEQLALDVDTENPSGAVGLYSSLGFVPGEHRSVAMVLSY